MNVVKIGENQYIQEVYFCRQDTATPDGKVKHNVGLAWFPVGDSWKPYCPSDLPATLDNGEDAKVFNGRERSIAKKYATELSEKYNLPIRAS